MALLAGIAALAGGVLLTKTDKKAAESVVFNARKFPKKLRIEYDEDFSSAGLAAIFFPKKGYYFAYSPSVDADKIITYDDEWQLTDGNSYDIFEKRFMDDDILFPRLSYDQTNNYEYREWYHHFGNLGLAMNLIDDIEWLPTKTNSDKTFLMADKTIKTDLISKARWDYFWDEIIDSGHDDRREAYWKLYTDGVYDSQMEDEPSIYSEMGEFFTAIKTETFSKINEMTEQQEYDAHIKMFNDEIDSTGTWPKKLNSWNSYNNLFGNTPFESMDGYEPSKEMIKKQVEWWLLKQNYLYHVAFDKNIQPLLNAGWNDDGRGEIVKNNRGAWDAYRDSNDTPNSVKNIVKIISNEQRAEIFYSKNLIMKNILKKRPLFLKWINEDEIGAKNSATIAKDNASLEAAKEMRVNLAATPPFSEMRYYDYIQEYDNYFDDFVDGIVEMYELCKKHLTKAEINSIEPKIKECFADLEQKEAKKELIIYTEKITALDTKMEKADDELAAKWKL